MAQRKAPDEVTALKRQAREYRRHLRDLTRSVRAYLAAIDAVMQEKESVGRGRKIGKLTSELEFANDSARHFGLGEKLTIRRETGPGSKTAKP